MREEEAMRPPLASGASDWRANAWWGLIGLCVSLGAVLTSLIVAYFYLAIGQERWPPLAIERPAPGLAIVATGVLLVSGLLAIWSDRQIQRWHPGLVKLGLAVLFVLGVGLLLVQVIEFERQAFDLGTNAYASAFLILLAFHAVQMVIWLAMAAAVQLWLWLGYYTARRNLAPRNVILFWYYLIASWLAVVVVLYLSPALSR